MSGGRWDDLKTRVLTGIALAAIFLTAIWLGGIVMVLLCMAAAAAMIWELSNLLVTNERRFNTIVSGLAALGVLSFAYAPGFMALGLCACVPFYGMARAEKPSGLIYAAYSALILAGGLGLISVRTDAGLAAVFWLIGVVIASDVGGYAGGRLFGGPKFWPRVSPKKTWSGTVTGWLLAALVAMIIGPSEMNALALAVLSAFVAFIAQMGDIAESAIKRRVGAKDASNFLPGHGGVMDRFDGMVAVFALALVLQYAPRVLGS